MKQAIQLVDEKEAIDFLVDLLRINSMNPPGKEIKVAEAIKHRFEKVSIDTILDEVQPDRANVFVTLQRELENKVETNEKVLPIVAI